MEKGFTIEKFNIALVIIIISGLIFVAITFFISVPPITTNITFVGGSNAIIYTMNITFSNYFEHTFKNFTINKAFETLQNGTTIPISNAFATKYFEADCLDSENYEINFIYNGIGYSYSCA